MAKATRDTWQRRQRDSAITRALLAIHAAGRTAQLVDGSGETLTSIQDAITDLRHLYDVVAPTVADAESWDVLLEKADHSYDNERE